jgi:hypothetical protein
MLPEKTADLIDEPDAIGNQATANPMNSLDRQLLGRLDGHEAHARSADRLADRLRIIPIVLVGFHVGCDELRADQSDVVTEFRKRLGPKVCAVRCLHADEARRQVCEKRWHGMTAKRLAQHRLSMSVDAVNLEDIFRQVQTNASDLHGNSPSMQLTGNRNPRREGGVHTIGAH